MKTSARPDTRSLARRRKARRDCACGKVRFKDHLEAVSFLHHAHNARRDADELGGETTHRAVRSYRCGRCHGYHVTSLAA